MPRDPAVARDLDDLLHATRRVPLTTPWYRVVVYTEDSALRHDLRVRGIDLGPRFSEDLAQQRRQFYTLEAKQSVAQARARMDALEVGLGHLFADPTAPGVYWMPSRPRSPRSGSSGWKHIPGWRAGSR